MDHRQTGRAGRDERERRGPLQPGTGQSGRGQYGYGGSGGSTYGAGGYGPYSGEAGGRGPREHWEGEAGYYGQGPADQPWRERVGGSGYHRPGPEGLTGYGGTQGGYGSSFYGRSGESQRTRWKEQPPDYYGEVQQGGSFFGGNEATRPGERQGLFRRMFRRGPKGYQRSDERLREDISERLMYAMHIDSSEVTVSVADGKVTLDGTVPERQMKHAIEDLVDGCPGVQDIDNRIRVARG